jgi:hypothetical protein
MAAALRKYVSVKAQAPVDDLGKAYRSMTFAYNRLGGSLTLIGENITQFKELLSAHTDFTLGQQERERDIIKKEHEDKLETIRATKDMLGREKGRKQDAEAEKKQESTTRIEKSAEKEGKKEKKSRFGWLQLLLKPMGALIRGLISLVAPVIAYKVLDWLERNQKKVEKLLGFIKAIWSFTRMISRWGLTQVMDGVTKVFGNDPDKNAFQNGLDKIFGILQIFGGIAALWLASRILMPWKLIGDVKFMTALGRGVKQASESDCMPDRKKPKLKKGDRVGRDGRTSRQRLKDMKRKVRIRRLNQLRRRLGSGMKRAAGRMVTVGSMVIDATKRNIKSLASSADNLILETGEQLAKTGGGAVDNLMGLGSFLKNKTTSAASGLATQAGKLKNQAIDLGERAFSGTVNFAKKSGAAIGGWWAEKSAYLAEQAKKMGSGIWNWGKNQAKAIGDVAAMAKDPKKLGSIVLDKVKGYIKPVIEKNETAKQVLDFAGKSKSEQVKSAKSVVGNFIKSGIRNPGFKSFREFLVAAKSSAKIGGIDKLVAAVLALLDYTVFGESPINAVLKALGGLLGYSAGFAIGAPFGGVPGFITGAAGGFAGEFIANKILKGLSMTPLKDIDDPVAEMLGADEGGGFMGIGAKKRRKLVRDPDAPQPWEQALEAAAAGDDGGEIAGPPKMAKGGLLRFDGGGEYAPDGKPKHPGLKKRFESITKMKFAAGGELGKLGDGTALVNAAAGMCTTGVILTAERNSASIGKPHVATGNDPNNPRGLMAQAVGEHGYGSIPGLGEPKKITSPYGHVNVNVMDLPTWTQAVKDKKIPSGSLIFSTRHSDWNNSASSSGNDSAIAKNGGQKLWSGHWQATVNGVGAVYGAGTKGIVALTHPGGNNVGYDGKTDNVTPGNDPGNGTSPSGGGGGEPSLDPKTEYLSAEKMTSFLTGKLGVLNDYVKDASPMTGSTPPAATDAKTSPTASINSKMETLAKKSEEKVALGKKRATKNAVHVITQPVVAQTPQAPQRVAAGNKGVSPLMTQMK